MRKIFFCMKGGSWCFSKSGRTKKIDMWYKNFERHVIWNEKVDKRKNVKFCSDKIGFIEKVWVLKSKISDKVLNFEQKDCLVLRSEKFHYYSCLQRRRSEKRKINKKFDPWRLLWRFVYITLHEGLFTLLYMNSYLHDFTWRLVYMILQNNRLKKMNLLYVERRKSFVY